MADGGIITVDGDTPQAIICRSPFWGEDTPAENDFWERHAALLASAPDLLDKLRMMVRVFNVKDIDPLQAFTAIEQAKHAITQATGTPYGWDSVEL